MKSKISKETRRNATTMSKQNKCRIMQMRHALMFAWERRDIDADMVRKEIFASLIRAYSYGVKTGQRRR